MTFAHLWVLHFLWLLPAAGLALAAGNRKKRRAMERLADPELLSRLCVRPSPGRIFLKSVFLLTGLGLMIFALAGPRWGSHYEEVSRKGVDIMVTVDVSPSMMVSDIKPNRLERARREILDFLRVARDRVGLVPFSGAAFVQCPLTLDYGALRMFIGEMGPDLIPVPGTDLGAAIDTALSAFDFTSETDRVILLITDGEDNENRGVTAARRAAEKGVRIFVFGMGDPAGGPVPATDGKGGFKKDRTGRMVLSKLNEEGLRRIADITGGTYVRSVAGDLDLDVLYFEGIRSETTARTLKSGKIRVSEERFSLFLLAAFLFLFLESVIAGGERDRRNGVWTGFLRFRRIFPVFLGMVFIGIPSARAAAAGDPDDLYRKGRFKEAEAAYAERDMNHPKDIRYRYNRGCAAYRGSDLDAARAAFSSVLRRTKDRDVRFRSLYNLGNTAYRQGDFREAVDRYRAAILLNPECRDVKYNLELALRGLEKQKREQEKQKTKEKKGNRPDQPGRSGQDRKNSGNGKKEKGGPEKDKRSPGKASQDQDRKSGKGEKGGGGEKLPEKEAARPQGGDQRSGEGPGSDLSGRLKPMDAMPGKQSASPAPRAGAGLDRKKAEALLDNLKEDRSGFLRFQPSGDRRKWVESGRDW